MLQAAGPWGIVVLLLGALSTIPSFIAILKKGDPRFLAMAGGIVCAALAFSVAATCMGLYQAGQFEGAEVAFSQKSLGIAVVPLFFGSILFALNAFLLGLARFLRR